jgi:dipeptidyl aminopeptidase/acylaminoacyl peptidase
VQRIASLSIIVVLSVVALGAGIAAAPAVERVEQGNLVIEGIPEIPERVLGRLRPYQNTRSAGMRGWHPSGPGILISTRFAETSQIHWVAEAGGTRRQITFFHEPVAGAEVSPNPEVNGFLLAKDVGGGEFYQLFFFDLGAGEWRMMTDGKSRNGAAAWAHDGERFAFYTTRRNGRDWDIHLGHVNEPGESTPVLEQGGSWSPVEFSPDDSRLLVVRRVSGNENYPHILDLATGKLTPIHPTEEPVAFSSLRFSRDGRGIYFTSDENSEFKRLRYHDVVTGAVTVLTDDIPWDVGGLELSDDGRHLAFTVNQDGISRPHLWTLPDREEVSLPGLPMGRIRGLHFSPDGTELSLVIGSPQVPGDVFLLDLATMELVRWTHSEVGGLRTDDFVTPELIRYPTFDQVDHRPRTIPAFYYRPRGDGPHPVLINIHGGPESQARPDFSANTQYLVNELGIAVLFPNVRGSSGYGKTYRNLDNDYQREDSVKDIGKLLDWIETRPELDADRVAVIGGSYGGYMVLASMVHFNDRLRAGVDRVGISNFVTFLRNTKDYRRDLRRVEYGDERIPEMNAFLERIAPANRADSISKPVLIVQGLNDPRVPVTESEQMVEEIRSNGGTIWYLLAKDEGHGFKKKRNRDYYEAVASHFLERYLVGEARTSATQD